MRYRVYSCTMEANSRALPYGIFFGRSEVRRELPGFSVSLLAPTLRAEDVRLHTHENASFVLVLEGSYLSSADGAPPVCPTSMLIFNPAGTTHRDSFRLATGRFLAVSLSDESRRVAAEERRCRLRRRRTLQEMWSPPRFVWQDRVLGPGLKLPLSWRDFAGNWCRAWLERSFGRSKGCPRGYGRRGSCCMTSALAPFRSHRWRSSSGSIRSTSPELSGKPSVARLGSIGCAAGCARRWCFCGTRNFRCRISLWRRDSLIRVISRKRSEITWGLLLTLTGSSCTETFTARKFNSSKTRKADLHDVVVWRRSL
jgi:hypothetical protein